MKLSRVQWAVLAVVLSAVAAFVWPTRYRYEHATQGRFESFVRIDRLTGRVQTLGGTEWLPRTDAGYVRVRDSAYAVGWNVGTEYLIGVTQQLALPETTCFRTAVRWAADLGRNSVTSQRASDAIRQRCASSAPFSPDNPFAPGATKKP